MGWKSGTQTRFLNIGSGGDYSFNIQITGAVGDVFACMVSEGTGGGNTVSVSSPSITWQLAEVFNHSDNSQGFEMWVGRCHTAFSANSETVSVDLTNAASYREAVVEGWEPESGYEFPSSGYFVDGASVTYAANSNPTSTDGFSATPALGGVSAKYLLIGLLATESAGLVFSDVAPGTGYTEHREWQLFDVTGCIGNWFSRLYDGSSNQAVLGTVGANASYQTSLAGIALKQVSIGGLPPHAKDFSMLDPLWYRAHNQR